MIVTFDDVNVMQQVKKTLTFKKGIKSISIPCKKHMCGLDRALNDVKKGHVTRWNSVEEMLESLNKYDSSMY